MAAAKNSTLTIRIEPTLKDALRAAAEAQHRSIANMVEVLIRDHCKLQDIAIQDTPDPPHKGGARKKQGRKGA